MALKIVGRSSRLSYSSDPVKVEHAREAMTKCSACGKMCFVTFPYYLTALKRQQIIKKALDEHRKVCTAGDATMARSYEIIRPRA
jgi:tRNA G26 N,N-dimethylase Trm1